MRIHEAFAKNKNQEINGVGKEHTWKHYDYDPLGDLLLG
jgi:hypothetical protein